MPFTVTMPKLSPTMEEGVIAKWHKKEGDQVEAGDLLLEIATDKATVEHNALDAGWLRKILIAEGKPAIVNQAIAVFTENKDESITGYKPTGAEPVKKAAETTPKEDKKSKTTEKQAPEHTVGRPSFVPEAPLEQYQFPFPTEKHDRVPSSPLARKLAKEKGVDLATVQGSGPHQRVVSKDLELAQPAGVVGFGRQEKPKVAPGMYEEEELTPMRKLIGKRMQESKSFIPHIYVQVTADAEPLISIREQLSQYGVKVSINDLIIRASALTLKQHPDVNSGYNSANHTIIRFKTIDISVAVSVPQGLVTPIIRHADYKNVGEISTEIRSLAKRAKEGKLEPQEYKGGSFTVSNLGMYGVTSFQAIINPPQAAILAVGGIQDVPVVKKGQVVPGKTINLTLSTDHQVIDGVLAAQFLKTLQRLIESPAILIV